MRKPRKRTPEMLNEYDFRKGVRGKYAKHYATATNIRVLSPDLAKIFPNSESENSLLREVVVVAQRTLK